MQLIRNEWMKIWKRPATLVMIVLLLIAVLLLGAFNKYQSSGFSVPDNENWKHGLELENKRYNEQLEDEHLPEETRNYYTKEIAINEYRITHNFSTNVEYSAWDFVADSIQLLSLAGLFTIIIAAGIVANEFNWGTIKLLLIRPLSRIKILLSKYLTVLLFGFLTIFIIFAFSFILGAILFGLPKEVYPYLFYSNGLVKEQSILMHLISYYGLNSISIFMLTTMAFMISSVFRNSSLAIGISIFLMFMGNTVTLLLANWFDWAKYLLFANTDLTQYLEGTPLVSGMTLSFSITMLVIYFVVFIGLAFWVFRKRDVAA
ncbi:ABC transporter permease [Niallia circulans]|uniref:ABC transporter permease n=1 Tax=Niallia circulans TaxID=1397 RepID=UPI00203BAD04|nr:ABC transporter permease [Niallia circulans]MCM2980627.1 ABC transporter permease [Niallia circulans]